MAFTKSCSKDRVNGVHKKDFEKRVKKNFNEKKITKNHPKDRINGGTQERYQNVKLKIKNSFSL